LGNWIEAVRQWWPATLLTAILGFLVLYPVAMLFVSSFRTESGAFSLAAYQKVFSTPNTYELI